MKHGLLVCGTDTNVGKTVASAMLMLALGADYWKPVQCGTAADENGDKTDTQRVRRMSGLPTERFVAERWVFRAPLSPHRAAELEGRRIDGKNFGPLPKARRPLIIEAAGGLLVPLNRDLLQIDAMALWKLPAILCARTALGGINHALLSLETLRRRKVAVLGLIFIGDANEDTERTIAEISGARRLGRLPRLGRLNSSTLNKAFERNFHRTDFARALGIDARKNP